MIKTGYLKNTHIECDCYTKLLGPNWHSLVYIIFLFLLLSHCSCMKLVISLEPVFLLVGRESLHSHTLLQKHCDKKEIWNPTNANTNWYKNKRKIETYDNRSMWWQNNIIHYCKKWHESAPLWNIHLQFCV
jgi:hypothetical protein